MSETPPPAPTPAPSPSGPSGPAGPPPAPGAEVSLGLLRRALLPIAKRERALRLLTGWLAVAAGAAVLALPLRLLEDRRGWDLGTWWGILTLAVAALAVLVWRRTWKSAVALDYRRAARLVEQKHPELGAILVTAIERERAAQGPAFGYLDERVIQEALDRTQLDKWEPVLPNWRFALLGAGLATALAVVGGGVLGGLFPNLPTFLPDAYGVDISPKDTEAERGTNVVVLARFHKKLPNRATLVVRRPGQPPAHLEMKQNLADPVFAAMTPVLDEEYAEYHVEYAGRRSRRYRIDVFRQPEVDRIDVRIAYPKHDGRPPREIADTRQVSVVEGARVTVTVHTTGEVRGVRLAGKSTIRLGPSTDGDGRSFWGVLPARQSDRFDVLVTDTDGRRNPTPPRFVLDVQKNAPPEIRLAFPGRDVAVSPLEEFAVEAQIADDVAVLGYGISYRLAGGPDGEGHSLTLGPKTGAKPPPNLTARTIIPLEELKAEPGALLTYHFWAEDVDARGKRRRSSSDMYFAEVVPFEARYREAMSAGQEESMGAGGNDPADDLIEKQKTIINATWRLERDSLLGRDATQMRPDIVEVETGQKAAEGMAVALRAEVRGARQQAALGDALEAMREATGHLHQASRSQPAPPLGRALLAEQRAYAFLLRTKSRDRQVGRGQSQGGGGGGGEPELSGLELKQRDSRYETRREAAADNRGPARAKRETLGRLEDLARRQKALTERIKETQASLSPKEEDEDERRHALKRLREEQQALLSDLDDLLQRLGQSGQSPEIAQHKEALERLRQEAEAASEAIAQGQTGRAVGASTRAARALERAKRELEKEVMTGFEEEVRELRADATELAETQTRLSEALSGRAVGNAENPGGQDDREVKERGARAGEQGDESASPGLNPTTARRLAAEANRQADRTEKLLDRLESVSAESEPSAPLLSRKLYEGLRSARLDGAERRLRLTGQLLEGNLIPQARTAEASAAQAIERLRQAVDEAAKGVLGDETKALRLAKADLDALIAAARQRGSGPGAPNGQDGQSGQSGQPGQSGQQPGQQPGQPSESGQPGQSGAQGQQPGSGAEGSSAQASAPGGGAPGQAAGDGSGGGGVGPQHDEGNTGGGDPGLVPRSDLPPVLGEDYRDFSDRLRDLQDLLDDRGLRNEAGRIRDRARSLRAEAGRDDSPQAGAPRFPLFEAQVLAPLVELRARVAEALTRLETDDKLVPIDRDPVPGRYGDLVRRYWKRLGEGK